MPSRLRVVPTVIPPAPLPQSQGPIPSPDGWVWNGANWVCNQPPAPALCPPWPCPPPQSGCWPSPCPPCTDEFPPMPPGCPPWFPPPAGQAPWYPGANGGVSFSQTAPSCPVRGHFWFDGKVLWLFDGAAWVDVGLAGISSLLPGAGVFIGSTAPPAAAPGALWWNGTVLQLWDGVKWNIIGPTAAPVGSSAALQGARSGLRIQAAGTGVTVTARQVVMYDGTSYSTAYNVSATANTGSVGAGGIDQGGLTGSQWYAVWMISNGTTTTAMLSQSSTTPMMPAGYAAKGMVGWVRSGSGSLVSTLQIGGKAQYIAPLPVIISGAQGVTSTDGTGAVTWVPASVGGVVPPTASVITVSAGCSGLDAGLTQVAPNSSYGDWATPTACTIVSIYVSTGGAAGPPISGDLVLESGNIYYVGDRSTCFAQCLGWWDGL